MRPGLEWGANRSAFEAWLKKTGQAADAGASPRGSSSSFSFAPSAPADYASLISADPEWKQANADLSAQGISDASQRGAAIARGLVQFGLAPDFKSAASKLGLSANDLGYLDQDVTDRVRTLADQNTTEGTSVMARLRDAFNQEQRGIKNQLAARGMAGSGESGFQLGESAKRFKQAQYDAQQNLADYVRNVYGQFLTSERQRQSTLRQGAVDAAGRARDTLGSTPPTAAQHFATNPLPQGTTPEQALAELGKFPAASYNFGYTGKPIKLPWEA